jgi:hypothetical protein
LFNGGKSIQKDSWRFRQSDMHGCWCQQNLWTTCGFVDGGIGTIVDLCGSGDVVDAIIVNVPSYSGPSLCAPHPCTWIPIPRSTSTWYRIGISNERKQFPLTLAYAITIHKITGEYFSAGNKRDDRHRYSQCAVLLYTQPTHACSYHAITIIVIRLQGLGIWLLGSHM